jgi:hypothetical protein
MTGTFTTYVTPITSGQQSALYGLLVTSSGKVWVTMLAENVIAVPECRSGPFRVLSHSCLWHITARPGHGCKPEALVYRR